MQTVMVIKESSFRRQKSIFLITDRMVISIMMMIIIDDVREG